MPDEESKKQPPRPFVQRLWRMAMLVSILACLPTILGFLGRVWYRFEWMSHFRVQYVFGLLPFVVVFLIGKRWRTAIPPAACMLINIALIVPLYFGGDRTDANSETIRAASINVLTSNRKSELVLDYISETKPDIVVLLEVNDRWMKAIEPLREDYPHQITEPREDNFGIALFSRLPVEESEIHRFEPARVPTIVAQLRHEEHPFTLIATHPVPPGNARCTCERDTQMESIARVANNIDTPLVLIGDLNTTSWSYCFRDFVKASGLRDSRKGFGVQASWPSFNPLLRIPLDHCLVSDAIVVHHREVGPFVGSDHYPILVDFSVKQLKKASAVVEAILQRRQRQRATQGLEKIG